MEMVRQHCKKRKKWHASG